MPFYLRKALRLGPIRFNLSRSGVGTSVGIPGFRIGIGPRGTYIHAGRGGLYYRRSLNPSSPATRTPEVPSPLDEFGGLQPIESADVAKMVEASAAELLENLNRVASWTNRSTVIAFLTIIALTGEVLTAQAWWIWGATVVVGIVAFLWAQRADAANGTLSLDYVMEPESEARYKALRDAFQMLGGANAVWHLQAAGHTDDWKRSAGATMIVKRDRIHVSPQLPPRIKSNLAAVPVLKAGRQRLYFFPDSIHVYDSSRVGVVAYSSLRVEASATQFAESDMVPSDAKQVGTTWRFVNKKGGPDRRFNDNYEIPLMKYGTLDLTSDSGLRESFQCSRPDAIGAFQDALAQMVSVGQLRE